MLTVYHDSFEAEKFCCSHAFCMSVKLFYMKVQDGTVHIRVKEKVRGIPQKFSTLKLPWYTVLLINDYHPGERIWG